jgi:L-ascorbate metabolism protein UlaG (beta-lactamase superfamily)
MDIQYIGHSSFRLKGKEGVVITDPFHPSTGMPFPSVKADIVTVSHQHPDHNNVVAVKPTAQRTSVFRIENPGEYEVSNISVYGYPTWHDDQKGGERGANTIYSIFLDDVHILHLGDLGHTLDEKTMQDIPEVDILICPVGGHFTIDPKKASEVISALEPSVIIPMHYRTTDHNETFAELATLEDFMKEYGKTAEAVDKFSYTKKTALQEEAETQLVVLQPRTSPDEK